MSDPDDSTGADSMLRDTTARIFADLADPQTLNAAPDTAWKAPLWAALEQAGLTLAWVGEANGGAGAETLDGFEILRVAGQYAAPVAIAERDTEDDAEATEGQVIALMAPGAFTLTERATDMGGERADITLDHVFPVEMAEAPAAGTPTRRC